MWLTVFWGELTAGWPGAQRVRERERQSGKERMNFDRKITPSIPMTIQKICQCVCECVVGKSRRDSNERPVSCISDHSSAHSCSLFHSVCISPWSQSITHWTPDKVSLKLLAWRCPTKVVMMWRKTMSQKMHVTNSKLWTNKGSHYMAINIIHMSYASNQWPILNLPVDCVGSLTKCNAGFAKTLLLRNMAIKRKFSL